jgi:hypothetical protein
MKKETTPWVYNSAWIVDDVQVLKQRPLLLLWLKIKQKKINFFKNLRKNDK